MRFRARRTDLTPRLEMTPLLDVVFLLLTFFIYSLVTMIRADVLPVKLVALSPGNSPEKSPAAGVVQAITIDAAGRLYFNREPITSTELDQRLADLARLPEPPRIYLAMEEQGIADRGPLLIGLIQRVQAAGLNDFALVGPSPTPSPPPTSPRK